MSIYIYMYVCQLSSYLIGVSNRIGLQWAPRIPSRSCANPQNFEMLSKDVQTCPNNNQHQRIPNLWGHWIGHPLCDEWSGAFAVENMCSINKASRCIQESKTLQRPVAAFGFIERVATWQALSPTSSRTVPIIRPPMSFTGSWCKWHTRYTQQNVYIAARIHEYRQK